MGCGFQPHGRKGRRDDAIKQGQVENGQNVRAPSRLAEITEEHDAEIASHEEDAGEHKPPEARWNAGARRAGKKDQSDSCGNGDWGGQYPARRTFEETSPHPGRRETEKGVE